MEPLKSVKDKIATFYHSNTKLSNVFLAGSLMYITNKAYKKWCYRQKIHSSKEQISNKVILITGCGSGFGNKLALRLSIDEGYRVIATCRRQESVHEFLSNSKFIANKSTSVVLNVADNQNIANVEQFVIKYLNDTQSVLWGLVNNAGFDLYAPFECISPERDALQRNVLLNGPMHITRTFLPLFPGRKNYVKSDKLEYSCEGGRIVNVSSIVARFCIANVRYGVSKVGISYFSHALRREISPRFGIWCCAVEPGGFQTNVISKSVKRSEEIMKELKENGKGKLLEIYDFDLDVMKPKMDEFQKNHFKPNYDSVIDDIIHGLTAKYPQREYVPGGSFISKMMEYAPLWMFDKMVLMGEKRMAASSQKKK